MKKVISAVFAVLFCMTSMMFSACGFSAFPESKGSAAGAKKLHMATNAAFEPYEYVEGGQVVGIDAEIARVICDKLGYTLVIDDMDFDAIIPAVTFSKGSDAVLALTQGELDAVVIDKDPAEAFTDQNIGIKILNDPFEREEYAICLKKDSELTEKFNTVLNDLKADGTVDDIIKKYINDN